MKILDWERFVEHLTFINEDHSIKSIAITESFGVGGESNEPKPTVDFTDPKTITVKKKVAYASRDIIGETPWFGKLLSMLKVVYTLQVNTAAVDGTHLFINPLFFEQLTLIEIKFIIYHEILHCALLHFTRLGGRDRKKFNYASDFEINLLLANADMPEINIDTVKKLEGLIDTKYAQWNAEQIYNDPDMPQPPPEKEDPDREDGEPGGDGTGGYKLPPTPPKEQKLKVGDVIYDKRAKTYGRVTSIDRTSSPATVEFDPMSKEDAQAILNK